jgi:hypothetical protein
MQVRGPLCKPPDSHLCVVYFLWDPLRSTSARQELCLGDAAPPACLPPQGLVCRPHLHRQVLPTLLPSPHVVSPLRRVACSNLGQLASSRFLSRAASSLALPSSSPPPSRPLQLPPPLSHSAAAPAPSLAAPCLPFLRCAPLPIYLYAGAPGLSHPRSLHLSLISPCPTIEAC